MAEGPRPQLSWWRRSLLAMAGVSSRQLSLTNEDDVKELIGGASSVSVTGKPVTDTTAMRISAVWGCNKVLSESIGMLPIAVFERQKNGNAEKVDHPLAHILSNAPNGDMTSVEFREAGQLSLGLRGNSYCFRDAYKDGEVYSLYPISSTVIPKRSDDGVITYRVLDRGKWETFPRERIWHVKGFGSDGLVGLSPVGAARESMGLAMATEEFQARFFGQGARPSAVATIPQWLKQDQRKVARENLTQLLGGLDNAHRLYLLEGGIKLEPWGEPLQDLQFLELRQFQVAEICRLYRVPPHMIADLSKATFSNIEQMSLEFVMYTLMPWLTRFEASANRWLLKPSEQRRFFVRFNVDGMLRATAKERGEFLGLMVDKGIMNRNEARGKENLNRSEQPGMDDYTVQMQMQSVSSARNPAPQPGAKA